MVSLKIVQFSPVEDRTCINLTGQSWEEEGGGGRSSVKAPVADNEGRALLALLQCGRAAVRAPGKAGLTALRASGLVSAPASPAGRRAGSGPTCRVLGEQSPPVPRCVSRRHCHRLCPGSRLLPQQGQMSSGNKLILYLPKEFVSL